MIKRFANFMFLMLIIPVWGMAITLEMYADIIFGAAFDINERMRKFVNGFLI